MAITDLTGTTWTVPSGWVASKGYGEFDITGVFIRPTYSYEFLGMNIGYASSAASSNVIRFDRENNTHSTFLQVDGGFELTITGGTDATNTDLIAWLKTYGELQ